jgi:superfamily II DNA or RNA helicase
MGFVVEVVPILTGAMSALPYSEGLEHLYTFQSAFDETVRGAVKQGNTLLVPRESVPYALPKNDYRTLSPSKPVKVTFIPRNEEQQKLSVKSLNLLYQGHSHLFEAPTGWGKTVVGGVIAASFGQPTLIVVTKEDLMHQWRDSLTQVLGISPSLIGHIQQDVCDWKGKQFVLGMVQSLIIEDKYPSEMYRNFGLLVLDEVHQMAAECFVRSCQLFTAKLRLGFSATPMRKDGKTKLLHWHIGQTLVKGTILNSKPKVLIRQTGWKIPYHSKLIGHNWQQVPIPHSPGRMMTVNKAIAASEGRNLEIVNFVVQSYKSDRITLVMSDLREAHLNRLFQMLTNEGIPGNDIGYYLGGMSKIELSHTKQRRVVLGTYKMCATGTDVPRWDTLVMATPRADVKQAIGRVLRAAEGKKQPVILDLVDYNAIFQGFHMARLKTYYAIGAEVVKVQ